MLYKVGSGELAVVGWFSGKSLQYLNLLRLPRSILSTEQGILSLSRKGSSSGALPPPALPCPEGELEQNHYSELPAFQLSGGQT